MIFSLQKRSLLRDTLTKSTERLPFHLGKNDPLWLHWLAMDLLKSQTSEPNAQLEILEIYGNLIHYAMPSNC